MDIGMLFTLIGVGLLIWAESRRLRHAAVRIFGPATRRLLTFLFMSTSQTPAIARERPPIGAVSPAAETVKQPEKPFQTPETDGFIFLARLIHAGVLKEGQALKVACQVRPGATKEYQDAHARLKAALEREAPGPHYVPLDDESRPVLEKAR